MKKMKEKYKDQDEEERQLRMEILAVSLEHYAFYKGLVLPTSA